MKRIEAIRMIRCGVMSMCSENTEPSKAPSRRDCLRSVTSPAAAAAATTAVDAASRYVAC